VISGSGSILTLDAAAGGTLTLANTASSTYGGVVIQAGTLKFASSAAMGNNPLTINGGTLDLNGLASPQVASLAGSGGVIETSSGTSALVVDPPSGATAGYSGSIVNGAGLVSLVKMGAGTLILSGSDTYTGGTTVDAGILEVSSSNGLPYGGGLTVGSGGTLTFGPAGFATNFASSPAMEPLASVAVSAVPEPGTLVLILAGLASLGLLTLRRRIGG
jgi:autotransporter-associated beta strand protein